MIYTVCLVCSIALHFSTDMRVIFHAISTSLRVLASPFVTHPRWGSVCTVWITWLVSSGGVSWVRISQSLVWSVRCVTPWMTMVTLLVKPWRRFVYVCVCVCMHTYLCMYVCVCKRTYLSIWSLSLSVKITINVYISDFYRTLCTCIVGYQFLNDTSFLLLWEWIPLAGNLIGWLFWISNYES